MRHFEYYLTDKIKGTIYGQAVGDALGLGTEFMNDEDMAKHYPQCITLYEDIVQDQHRKRWRKGDWTDDTDMMLCIARAVIEDRGVNLKHIAQNFKDWANREPMGIGKHTFNVLMVGNYIDNPIAISKMVWELNGRQTAANGGLMRTSIVGLFPKATETCAAEICKLTHYDPRCVGSCVIVSELVHALVYDEGLPTYQQIVEMGRRYDRRIEEFVKLALSDDIKALCLQDTKTMGYTLCTLSTSLWAYWHAETFEEGLLTVVRAGGDADTNAAVACAILGAKFGFHSIPEKYIKGLNNRNILDSIASGMEELITKS